MASIHTNKETYRLVLNVLVYLGKNLPP